VTKDYKSVFDYGRLYEMSNLFPEDTGLKFKVWISTKSGREGYNARIKISNAEGTASVMIWGTPKIKDTKGKITITGNDLKDIVKFVELNREELLKHWGGETSSKQFTNAIKSIKKNKKGEIR